MMARPYRVVVVLLLLEGLYSFGEGASNPGFVARITRQGLEYAHQYAIAALKKELSTFRLPDFSGSFKPRWVERVSYDFHSLQINHFKLQNSDLSLLPGQGIRASLSNSYMSVGGDWKVKQAFITLQGSFDLRMDGISISVSLHLGKSRTGRPTASVAYCSSSIDHVDIDISGSLSWIMNLFHEIIENNIQSTLEEQICEMAWESTDSHLKSYLQTLPVTLMIDQVAGIDYRLVEAPQVTSEGVDAPFKGEFFSQSWRIPVPFDAPDMKLPQQYDRMIYFAVSEYFFNTALRVYYQAGLMNIIIQNEHLPPGSSIPLHTDSFGALAPQLARLYPHVEVELEASPESEPRVQFTPGNVIIAPVMDVQAFALLPSSSDRKPLFQLRVKTNLSITISVDSNRIIGSVTTGSKLQLELKHSSVGPVNVELMEAVFNYYTLNIIYPSLNAKLQEGFPLLLPRDTFLHSVELQIHEHFLLLGADIN